MLVAGDEGARVQCLHRWPVRRRHLQGKSVPVERISDGWAVNLGGRLQRVPACSRNQRFGALLNSVDESPTSGFWRNLRHSRVSGATAILIRIGLTIHLVGRRLIRIMNRHSVQRAAWPLSTVSRQGGLARCRAIIQGVVFASQATDGL